MTTMKIIVVLKRLNVLNVKISKQLKVTQPARNSKNEKKHIFPEDNSTSTFLTDMRTNLINDHYDKYRCF